MKFLTKTVYEGGSILRLTPEAYEPIPDNGKNRVNIYDVERQEIFGFGGAFTESSAYIYAQLDATGKERAMELLFGKTGLRFNFCRLCIASSDFAVGQYDYLDEGDTTLASFSIERDRKYVIPMIKDAMAKAKSLGETIKFVASPWSPPAFMKDNNSRTQGHLRPECLALYAEYIMKFIEAYAAEGIHIDYLTPQNEPLAPSKWDSCQVTREEEIALIKALDAARAAHGLDFGILIFDHNKGRLYHRAEALYPEIGDMVAGAGFHWYCGAHYDELSLLHERYPDKVVVKTEFCNGLGRKIFNTYGEELVGNMTHWCNAEIEWNLLLGPLGEPYQNRAFGCSAPVHAMEDGTLVPRGSYHEMFLFSNLVRRGARALATSTYNEGVQAAAFRNPDGRLVVIIRNSTDVTHSYYLSIFDKLIAMTITPNTMVAYEIEA